MRSQVPTLRLLSYMRSAIVRAGLQRQRPCLQCGELLFRQQRYAHTPAEDPSFQSVVDNPPLLVRSGQKHGPGLFILSGSSYIDRGLYFP